MSVETIIILGVRSRAPFDAVHRLGRQRDAHAPTLRNRVHVARILAVARRLGDGRPAGGKQDLREAADPTRRPLIREGHLDIGGRTNLLARPHGCLQVRQVAARLVIAHVHVGRLVPPIGGRALGRTDT